MPLTQIVQNIPIFPGKRDFTDGEDMEAGVLKESHRIECEASVHPFP
jgi:hypothetical protein